MIPKSFLAVAITTLFLLPFLSLRADAPNWVATSNKYAKMLIDVEMEHHPEEGSEEGLSQYDNRVAQPTLADEKKERQENEAVLAKLKDALKQHQQKEVAQDLQIMIHSVELSFQDDDFKHAHDVPFYNPSEDVFSGLHILLDAQTAESRRPAAIQRIREYAGLEPGYEPLTEIYEQRIKAQMAKPEVIYPSKTEIETELGRNSNYLKGIAALLRKYKLTGWEKPYATLESQLTGYDAWMNANVLPKARTDFRLPPEQYALNLQEYGVDISPEKLEAMAHAAFTQIQNEMKPIAAEVAKKHHFPSSDYRDVMRELKKEQVVGKAILPLYRERLEDIEKIINQHQIVSMPERQAEIRLATAAETAQEPAPHMQPPPFMHNTGQKGVFVLPLNIPASPGQPAADKYDDFTFDAASWTLIAHEARPGHELQFDSMVEHGVSLARYMYAFNSTNVEGWGLYSESLIEPYMPPEGQLVSLDYRMLRAARAFLDPELQEGKVTTKDAFRVLEQDVVQSHAFAEEEVERYTYRAPGQATSYFYGFNKLLALRKEAEDQLGPKFNLKKFNDFILAQGLLPPDLMREAVENDFIPQQKK